MTEGFRLPLVRRAGADEAVVGDGAEAGGRAPGRGLVLRLRRKAQDMTDSLVILS